MLSESFLAPAVICLLQEQLVTWRTARIIIDSRLSEHLGAHSAQVKGVACRVPTPNKQHMFSLPQASRPLFSCSCLRRCDGFTTRCGERRDRCWCFAATPKQPPTTAGDWSSILLHLVEKERWERGGGTWRGNVCVCVSVWGSEWGCPQEMFRPIRWMLMTPSASVRCNTFRSFVLLAPFLFVHAVVLRLYWPAAMTEMVGSKRMIYEMTTGSWNWRIKTE